FGGGFGNLIGSAQQVASGFQSVAGAANSTSPALTALQGAAGIAGSAMQVVQMIGTIASLLVLEGGGIIPSAAAGMISDGSGPKVASGYLSLLHENEMVLPARVSQRVQDAARSASSNRSNPSAQQAGDTHIH